MEPPKDRAVTVRLCAKASRCSVRGSGGVRSHGWGRVVSLGAVSCAEAGWLAITAEGVSSRRVDVCFFLAY